MRHRWELRAQSKTPQAVLLTASQFTTRFLLSIPEPIPFGVRVYPVARPVCGQTVRRVVAWYHRNERSVWAGTLRHQGIGELIPEISGSFAGADFRDTAEPCLWKACVMMILSVRGGAPEIALSATADAACLATASRCDPSQSNTVLKPQPGQRPVKHYP